MNSLAIDLDAAVITKGCAFKILRVIVELLLYHRGQIPLTYSTFRTLAQNLQQGAPDERSFPDVKLRREREKAHQVVQSTEHLFDLLEEILTNHASLDEIMILFGRTIYTAREAFVVKLPTIDVNHYAQFHQDVIQKVLRNVAMQLVLSDVIVNDDGLMGSTKVFVMLRSSNDVEGSRMEPISDYQLPKRCVQRTISLQTKDTHVGSTLECCKQLIVYNEESETAEARETSELAQNGTIRNENSFDGWYLLDTVVEGFQTKMAKGRTVWN